MARSIKEAWNISEGQYEGRRIIVRQNVEARPIVGNDRYPFRVGIAIPFISPQKDGMPNEDEIIVLERIEDLIYDYFQAKHTGILCIVITTQGMREFIVYSAINRITDLTGSLSRHFPRYDIQHYVEQDKEWDVYRQWDA